MKKKEPNEKFFSRFGLKIAKQKCSASAERVSSRDLSPSSILIKPSQRANRPRSTPASSVTVIDWIEESSEHPFLLRSLLSKLSL